MTARKMIVAILQKTGLNRLAHKLYYNHFHGFNAATASTVEGVKKALAKAQSLGTLDAGDYYEFGIFKGFTFMQAQKIAAEMNQTTLKFYGFDSFEGLPDVKGRDVTGNDDFYKGQYHCSYDQVRSSLDDSGMDWNRTRLIKGYFNESLKPEIRKKWGMGKISIALIDCDLYSSTVDVLNFIEPMIMHHTILIFDDWNCFNEDNERGQRKAFAEFLERNPTARAEPIFSYGSWGQSFQITLG